MATVDSLTVSKWESHALELCTESAKKLCPTSTEQDIKAYRAGFQMGWREAVLTLKHHNVARIID